MVPWGAQRNKWRILAQTYKKRDAGNEKWLSGNGYCILFADRKKLLLTKHQNVSQQISKDTCYNDFWSSWYFTSHTENNSR